MSLDPVRTKWMMDSRFGMFIHWGIYSIPPGDVWNYSIDQINPEKYEKYFDEFDPVSYDPKKWAALAAEAGMKYAVMTAKHHDGFCLFDSALTGYKATKTKAGKDLIAGFAEAFREKGMKVGFYYSLLDWHHPDYPHYGDITHPVRKDVAYKDRMHDFDKYLEYMHGQIRELCTNYGKVDILWLDFSYGDMAGKKWKAVELVRMVRQLQPEIIIDNRLECGGDSLGSIYSNAPTEFSGDFASPEQIIPPEPIVNENGELLPWEACMTMNESWSYNAADRNFKPPHMIIRKLVECVSKGGNLLLNVGPDPYGRIPEASVNILKEVGKWMRQNAGSIYGCGVSEYEKPQWGWFTQRDKKVYAHIFEPAVGPHAIPLKPEEIRSIRLLADGAEVPPVVPWNAGYFKGYAFVEIGEKNRTAVTLPDGVDTVLEIEIK